MDENLHNSALIAMIFSFSVFVFGLICSYYFLNTVQRQKKLLLEHQVLSIRFREELLRSVLEIQEHAFQSIGREIHDNAGQLLSLAKLNLNNIIPDFPGNETLVTVKDLVTRAIHELREIANAYHAESFMQEGLLTAIGRLLAQVKRVGGYRVIFNAEVDHIGIPGKHVILLYRVIQEALNNITRHADATEISVVITRRQNQFLIVIRDNGKGFDPQAAGFRPGLGLRSMAERVAMTGGAFSITSHENEGTTITITLKEKYDHDCID